MTNSEFHAHWEAVCRSLYLSAHRLMELGAHRDAIDCWHALSTGDPDYESGEHAFEIGRCHEALGEWAEALRYYEIAEAGNPGIPERGAALARLRERVKAR